MTHRCENGCRRWVNDDRRYCIECERLLFGSGGIKDEELEPLGDNTDNRDEAGS